MGYNRVYGTIYVHIDMNNICMYLKYLMFDISVKYPGALPQKCLLQVFDSLEG